MQYKNVLNYYSTSTNQNFVTSAFYNINQHIYYSWIPVSPRILILHITQFFWNP